MTFYKSISPTGERLRAIFTLDSDFHIYRIDGLTTFQVVSLKPDSILRATLCFMLRTSLALILLAVTGGARPSKWHP